MNLGHVSRPEGSLTGNEASAACAESFAPLDPSHLGELCQAARLPLYRLLGPQVLCKAVLKVLLVREQRLIHLCNALRQRTADST